MLGLFKKGLCAKNYRYWLTLVASLVVAFNLTACGGGDSSGEGNGQVIVSLTDAQGDFATYTVDVLSVKLTHADGREVETLPLTTRVDFAQYTDLTEFLTAATVPNGRYVKGSLVLDYSNADIQVEDTNGNLRSAPPASDYRKKY